MANYDVAEMVRIYPCLDWGRVLTEANRLGNKRMLLLSLNLTQELLGASLP